MSSKKYVFVIVSAAIPVIDPMNTMAAKVIGIFSSSKRAENLLDYLNQTQKNIVYGLECKIFNKIVKIELLDHEKLSNNKVFAVLAVAIPKQKGKNPVQFNVHSVTASRSKAEEIFGNIRNNSDTSIKDTKCEIQSSIIEVELNKA